MKRKSTYSGWSLLTVAVCTLLLASCQKNNVTITQFSGNRVAGTFSVVNAGYGPRMTDKTTIQGKFKAKVFAQ
ncbi:hypothetical protein [Niabella soli]|uniref:Uncharacterized protein n=1 Tax=Niabella soli DSM 19437 TaxID=929713 RepID=W0F6Z3_9BACT|nr:hypothetical protein [Niabella soli]AHF17141.1 hypothetical protein NIASO_02405 [Niabella soli DSM 19437]